MVKISTAEALELLRQDPAGSFELTAHIDMTDKLWTPVDFSGCLQGNGYTISNLRVEKTEGRENAGFFGILSGTVTGLHLRDAYICANGTQFAGVLAGVISGKAEDCTVTGQLCNCTGAVAGAVAGSVTGIFRGGTAVTAQSGPHTEEGLCADVAMESTVKLVGQRSETAQITGFWRDSTYALSKCHPTLQQRRKVAIQYMRDMATVCWQIDQDKLEYIKNRTVCIHYQNYVRGKVYQGIPYAHSGGSLARCLSIMASCKDGVYTTKPNLQNGEYYVGEVAESLASEGISIKDNYGFVQYMGNDCSSSVSWSWRQVSSVDMAEGGCYGRYSGNMVPTEENKKNHGILPVGDFFACSEDTRLVYEQVGEEPLYEAYAKSLPGDAICGVDNGGHVLMMSKDAMVIRDGDGKIEPNKSFLITIEQGAGFFDSKGSDNHFREDLPSPQQTSWRVDYRYNFRNLARNNNYPTVAEKRKHCGCDHVYLPITMQALQQVDTPAVTPRIWMEGAVVRSNFYIMATEMAGEVIFTQVSHDWHIYREFPTTAVDLAKTHNLQPGSYQAIVHLSSGQKEPVEFTV